VDEQGRLLGVVTSLDLLCPSRSPTTRSCRFSDVMTRPVSSVMSRDAQTVCPRTPLTRVLQKLVDSRNKSFPVVDGDRVVGIVAREDVMRALRRAEEGWKP
jgi:CBS domain-containing protein